METALKVVVLSHTPEFEQNIVRGAKLCYSSADIESLRDKVTPAEAEKFLNMIMGLGHGSVLEHSCITFGIEGVSRSLTHQLVRHRIASYSQKSQRYVKEGQFTYVVPKEIKRIPDAHSAYLQSMKLAQNIYDTIVETIMLQHIYDACYELEKQGVTSDDVWLINCDIKNTDKNRVLKAYKEYNKKHYSQIEKIAIENARYVLPNACETKIQVTMNVRTLFNFFKERLCDRAQEEIRDLAFEMWKVCMEISPTIFKHAVPTCVNGKCKEGAMSCGKMLYYKEKHNSIIEDYKKAA